MSDRKERKICLRMPETKIEQLYFPKEEKIMERITDMLLEEHLILPAEQIQLLKKIKEYGERA